MRTTLQWLILFENPVDAVGFALFLLVFPIYHGVYPYLIRLFPQRSAKTRVDAFRRSWIEGLLERKDIIAAAQQTRNLTMVNSVLASSALILIGVTANVLIRYPQLGDAILEPEQWSRHPDAQAVKLFLLIVVFAVAFSYCMTSLRHLGHFNLAIGADPKLISDVLDGLVRPKTAAKLAPHVDSLNVMSYYHEALIEDQFALYTDADVPASKLVAGFGSWDTAHDRTPEIVQEKMEFVVASGMAGIEVWSFEFIEHDPMTFVWADPRIEVIRSFLAAFHSFFRLAGLHEALGKCVSCREEAMRRFQTARS